MRRNTGLCIFLIVLFLTFNTIAMPNTNQQVQEYEELMNLIADSDVPGWVAEYYGYTIEPTVSSEPANAVLTD